MEALTQDEIRRLLAAAKERSRNDWLMILVAYLDGLPASEVVSCPRIWLPPGCSPCAGEEIKAARAPISQALIAMQVIRTVGIEQAVADALDLGRDV